MPSWQCSVASNSITVEFFGGERDGETMPPSQMLDEMSRVFLGKINETAAYFVDDLDDSYYTLGYADDSRYAWARGLGPMLIVAVCCG